MLALAIIGLLMAIAVPKFADLIWKAREATLKGQLGALRSALTIYYTDNEGFYPIYGWPLPPGKGILALDGKYIDLDKIRFPFSRAHSAWTPASLPASEWFSLTGPYIGWSQNCSLGAFPNLAPMADVPLPQYVCYWRQPVTLAEIIISCVHEDSRGIVWSAQ